MNGTKQRGLEEPGRLGALHARCFANGTVHDRIQCLL